MLDHSTSVWTLEGRLCCSPYRRRYVWASRYCRCVISCLRTSQYAVVVPSVPPTEQSSCVNYRIRTLLRRSTLATACCESLTMVRWIPWLGTSTSVRTWVAGTAPSVASCFVSTFWFTRDTSWPARFTATGTVLVTLSFTGPYASLILDILSGFPRKNVGVSYLNIYLLFIHGLLKKVFNSSDYVAPNNRIISE
jgi:hypothetical protein